MFAAHHSFMVRTLVGINHYRYSATGLLVLRVRVDFSQNIRDGISPFRK